VKKPTAKLKRYLVVPRDAMDVLDCRFADLDEAKEAASSACAETGQAHYVLDMRA
jgi:hypothetical protein